MQINITDLHRDMPRKITTAKTVTFLGDNMTATTTRHTEWSVWYNTREKKTCDCCGHRRYELVRHEVGRFKTEKKARSFASAYPTQYNADGGVIHVGAVQCINVIYS